MKPNIALVAFESLGDSLMHSMIAENLYKNGYNVTLYSSILSSLDAWFENFKVLPFPDLNQIHDELGKYHLTLMSPPSVIRRNMSHDEIKVFAEKYVFFCQRRLINFNINYQEALLKKFTGELLEKLKPFCNCGNIIRYEKFEGLSVVEITLKFLKNKMSLEQISKNISLTPPTNLLFRKNNKRITISPDSAGPEKKNWKAEKYLKLAKQLEQKGYSPHIVVSPQNHSKWNELCSGKFPCPKFENFEDWAKFLYESGCHIGNDSGNGHLASFLGIPTITIYRKRNKKFHWRPDWKAAKVITPRTASVLFPKKKWHNFISEKEIISEVDKALRK